MKTYKYLIYDEQEGYFDIYIFSTPVEITELKNLIKEHKESLSGGACAEWNLETIEKEIRKRYKVKDVILFEDGYNANEIMSI